MRLTAGLACFGGWLLAAAGAAQAGSSFAWAPGDNAAVARGREVAARFDQASMWEISVEVNDAFSLDNRRAIAVAEEELRRIPGVRRVFGPAQLADLTIDARGRISARPVLDRGPGEGEDEASRQRVVRRADALGWFLAPDGSRVRFLVDADDLGAAREPLERAVASSGLQLLHAAGAHLGGQALWPDPAGTTVDAAGNRDAGSDLDVDVDVDVRWSAAYLAAAWVLFVLWGGRWTLRSLGRYPRGRRPLVVAAGFVGAGALFALCAVPPVRGLALRAALAAAAAATLGLVGDPPSVLRGLAAGRRAARPPLALIGAALALVLFAASSAAGVRIGTQQWRRTPFLFVSVRGDLEQPVVLREVRRLTDFLRVQPGIANAWSVADLLFGVAQPGEEVSRIPDSADTVRRLLVQARNDPAVTLELAPDHREGLVVVRFDDETPADRLAIHDRLALYLRTELRPALVRVDLSDPHLSTVTRSFGRGLLASDARERIVRICARSGRTLNDTEIAAVERAARQAAVVPAADLGKLKAEIAAIVRDFAQEPVAAGVLAPGAAERARLADQLGTASSDATIDDTRRALTEHLASPVGSRTAAAGTGTGTAGAGAADDSVAAMARALHPRLARARQRHAARINFRAMLYGADLPTEGMLSDEVRSATLEAMGPIVGIPVARGTPGAFLLDAVAVGGAANDQALSDYLRPALRAGLFAGVAALAVLLIAAGRARGFLWLPVALAPPAVVWIAPVVLGVPVGMTFLSFVAGAFAGGAVWTVALASRRAT